MLNVEVSESRVQGSFHASCGRLAVVGLSGSGKTSLFRIITGLAASQAHVEVDHRNLSTLPPYQRPIAFVPQRPSLVPHKTIAEQVAWVQRTGDDVIHQWRRILALEPLWHRRPPELSGGEQQRAALLRAWASNPRILLLDEALSNVDRPHRRAIWEAIAQHWPDNRLLVFSTHEWDEAEAHAETILYVESGTLYPLQARSQVAPATPSMARLMGYIGALRDRVGRTVLLHPRLVLPGTAWPDAAIHIPGTLTITGSSPLTARYQFENGGHTWTWTGPPAPSGTYDGLSLAAVVTPAFEWDKEGER